MEEYEFPHARYEPSLYLWDFLRKSKGACGYLLPLSGGLDSCAVAMIVYNMCCLVYHEIVDENNMEVLKHLRNIMQNQNYEPKSPE